jgi:hypothetical protein
MRSEWTGLGIGINYRFYGERAFLLRNAVVGDTRSANSALVNSIYFTPN